jgi:hypothetical protein
MRFRDIRVATLRSRDRFGNYLSGIGKHAFQGRMGGTITLHSLTDSNGCRVTIEDDGVGLPEGVEWPKRSKLGALIVRPQRV